jgi:hypothetical protein
MLVKVFIANVLRILLKYLIPGTGLPGKGSGSFPGSEHFCTAKLHIILPGFSKEAVIIFLVHHNNASFYFKADTMNYSGLQAGGWKRSLTRGFSPKQGKSWDISGYGCILFGQPKTV